MAVTVTTTVVGDGRKYDELPPGIQRWTTGSTDIGDGTGGDASAIFQFNPQSLNVFQPYVSLSYFSLMTTTADPLEGVLQQVNGHWEKSAVAISMALFPITPVAIQGTNRFAFVNNEQQYIGRALPDVTANLRVLFDNVDTCVYNINMAGFIADRPFIPNALWRA